MEADPEKKDPRFFKTWNKCYTKKDGNKVNKVVETFGAKDLAEVEERTQRSEGEVESNETLLFAEIAGGKKKGRIPGMGSKRYLVLGQHCSYYGDGSTMSMPFTQMPQFKEDGDG